MDLTDDNFFVFAAKYYKNESCTTEEEFLDDLQQLKTIRRMMSKFISGGDVNIRLLVNNIIIFYNVFDNKAATKMLQEKIVDKDQIEYFNAVLSYLSLPLLQPEDKISLSLYTQLNWEFA